VTEIDLRLLDEYRRQFETAIGAVMTDLKSVFQLEPAARPAKSTIAIVAKLQRESVRLSQMQDITGCRAVVANIEAQQGIVECLAAYFQTAQVVDRRTMPSHGYRAVHIIVKTEVGHVEIQIRTELQHIWAQLSEAWADHFGADLKYGGGPASAARSLADLATLVSDFERHEQELPSNALVAIVNSQYEIWQKASDMKRDLMQMMRKALADIESLKSPDK
jgi:putative GTP pyrophosphokinase